MPFDGSQLDDVTKLLIEGRERIERDGWWTLACPGLANDKNVCLMLAVARGNPPDRVRVAAENVLMRAVGAKTYFAATAWNDAPERTKAEVLAVYDTAISLG